MPVIIKGNFVGRKFNRLTVKSQTSGVRGAVTVVVECECGRTITRPFPSVRKGNVKSCGCLDREVATAKVFVHGQTGSPTHTSWRGMRQRCNARKGQSHRDYVLRGITMDERWNDFRAFLEDMGERPLGTSLDRIDNDKGYYKENCRWATRSQQNSNTRANKIYSHDGKSMTLTDWANVLGVPASRLNDRVNKLKWPLEKVFSRKLYRQPSAPRQQ